MKTLKLMIGSDPEIFGLDNSTGNISSFAGLLGADKYNKKVVSDDIRIQEDNVLLEFDINPHSDFESFDENMKRGLSECEKIAKSVNMSIVENLSSHEFTYEELKTFHESAFVFGCEPDFNAMTGMKNPKPKASAEGLRTAGGHIHIGFDSSCSVDNVSQAVVGVMCDYYLGLPSLLLDSDDRRRELYGKAGACRYKPYGIEYRTLSNFWTFSKQLREWAWEGANKAFMSFKNGSFEEMFAIVTPEEIQNVINSGDKHLAEFYGNRLGVI